MPFDLDRLLPILNQAGLQSSNNPLYQVIFNLLKAVQAFQTNSTTVSGASAADITTLKNRTYWTELDETVNLPASRMVLAGTNIALDYSIPGEVTIDASGGGSGDDYVVMSDGGLPTPSPVDDGFGNFVYVLYSP